MSAPSDLYGERLLLLAPRLLLLGERPRLRPCRLAVFGLSAFASHSISMHALAGKFNQHASTCWQRRGQHVYVILILFFGGRFSERRLLPAVIAEQ